MLKLLEQTTSEEMNDAVGEVCKLHMLHANRDMALALIFANSKQFNNWTAIISRDTGIPMHVVAMFLSIGVELGYQLAEEQDCKKGRAC